MSQYQVPPPMRVIPVTPTYAQPLVSTRPGALTAIGVISIILAVLAMIANASSAFFGLVSIGTSQAQQMFANRDDVDRYPLVDLTESASPGAMSEADALAVAQGLSRVKPLTPVRIGHVTKLARLHGKTFLPFAASGVSTSRVAANVSDSGLTLGSGGARANYYVLGEGRLEVSDALAIFRADDGNTYRSTDPGMNNSISEPSIDAMLRSFSVFGVAPNTSQTATIQSLLRDPKQQIVANESAAMVVGAGALKDGGLWFRTNDAQVRMDSKGTAILLSPGAPDPGTNPLTGAKLTTRWASLLMLESLASGLVAILLLVAAIFILRGKPIGRKLLLIWSVIKLPLALMGAAVLGLAISEWLAAMASDDTMRGPSSAGAWVTAALSVAVGVVWPVIVLLAMTRQTVRDYFRNVV